MWLRRKVQELQEPMFEVSIAEIGFMRPRGKLQKLQELVFDVVVQRGYVEGEKVQRTSRHWYLMQ